MDLDEQGKDLTNDCISMTKQGNSTFFACVHEGDDYITRNIHQHGVWEHFISAIIVRAMRSVDNPIFLDMGANLGIHSLFTASQGFKVIAVEPLKVNVVRMYHSKVLSGMENRITIVKNGISNTRRLVDMAFSPKNVGGSRLVELGNTSLGQPRGIPTVLISDILDFIKDENVKSKISIVLKIDIEGEECKAILGSVQSFAGNDFYYIPIIIMEWVFWKFQDSCPVESLQLMTYVFTTNGYSPFHTDMNTPLNKSEFSNFQVWPSDMVWVHESAVSVLIGAS